MLDDAHGIADDVVIDRLLAFLVDFTLLSVGAFVVWLGFWLLQLLGGILLGSMTGGLTGPSPLQVVLRLAMWAVVGALVGGYFVYTTASSGQSIGKELQDVVTVSENGTAVGVGAAVRRTAVLLAPLPLMALLQALLGWFGFLLALGLMAGWLAVEAALVAAGDGRRLGDRLAGTVVVSA